MLAFRLGARIILASDFWIPYPGGIPRAKPWAKPLFAIRPACPPTSSPGEFESFSRQAGPKP
jgi:hypothetical protein